MTEQKFQISDFNIGNSVMSKQTDIKKENTAPVESSQPASGQPIPSEKKSCQQALSTEQEQLRKGRRSLVAPSRGKSTIKFRYIEGSTPLKDGCWLSD